MYDRRDNQTLYPQMVYVGIFGQFKNERPELLPAIETTFGMWKKMYPEAKVAKFGTGLERYPSQQRNSYQNPQFYGYVGTIRLDDAGWIRVGAELPESFQSGNPDSVHTASGWRHEAADL
tara:strand:+ start:146 stop:505 length:360 start_codon:yes stop_codon:yes gene_type:complete